MHCGSHIASAGARVLLGFTIALENLHYLTGDARLCAPQ
jgi:hypothetical protein